MKTMTAKLILPYLLLCCIGLSSFAQTESSPEIYTIVEKKAEFLGGEEAMFKYIGENLSYPESARDEGIQGLVYVTFVIIETGKVTDVKVLRGIGGGCDEEAVRVVRSMPDWIPGTQRGKEVRIQYNLPIRFTLTKKKKKKKATSNRNR